MKAVNEAWRDAIIEERDKEIQRLRAALEAAPLASDIGMQYWTEYVSWYNGQRNQALEQE
jgi:hypothetical protein